MATAGDINDDGYSDVIVGANKYDNGSTDEGRVYVYYGSSYGLTISGWTAEADQSGAQFGFSVELCESLLIVDPALSEHFDADHFPGVERHRPEDSSKAPRTIPVQQSCVAQHQPAGFASANLVDLVAGQQAATFERIEQSVGRLQCLGQSRKALLDVVGIGEAKVYELLGELVETQVSHVAGGVASERNIDVTAVATPELGGPTARRLRMALARLAHRL